MLEEIRDGGALLAIILRSGYSKPGISFFTPDDLSQQLAYMRHPAGKTIAIWAEGASYQGPGGAWFNRQP